VFISRFSRNLLSCLVSFAGKLQNRSFAAVAVLMVCSLTGFAQSELNEQTGRSDVAIAVRQLSAETQTQSATQGSAQNDLPVRIIPFGRGLASQAPLTRTAPASGVHLTYWGGPVISNMQVVVVFWNSNVSSAITANGAIDQFYTDITSSRYFDLLSEYATAGIVGSNGTSTTNQSIGHGTFGGKFTITPAQCPASAATPCTVTDAQIQTELNSQITANNLPAPQTVGGLINTYYAFYFPPGVTIQLDATTKSCVNGGFCAYHGDTTSGTRPYGVMPDFSTGGCSLGCGAGTTLQIATNVSSHEMAEAVTDADVGTATSFGPPLGWYDPSGTAAPDPGEIADICDPPAAPESTVSAGGHSYIVEPLFSNLQNDCVTAPPIMHMPDTGAGPGVSFNLALTVQNSNTTATLSGYRGTVHFTSSDPGAVLPADYTFVSGDAGSHTFQFTLNTLGSQTVSVVDTRSGGFTGTANVTVSAGITDLAASGSAAVISTAPGATGITFATTVHNNGGVASTGTVSVVTSLGSGLSATALAGTGWSCTLATLTCTRTDAVASGSNYPDVTVTFNVAANAPATSSISSTVSGGGDTNLGNNTANATVNIGPAVSIGSSTPATNTIPAGGSAQYVVAVTLGPTAGTTAFSCTGLPTAATCAFSPTSLSSSGNVTMTVTTTARGTVVGLPRPTNPNPWLPAALLSLMAAVALGLMVRTRPRARKLAPVLGACAFVLAGILAGCGGGGNPQTITNPIVGTPAGTYTLTFTATSPNGSASKTMTLTVN